MTIIQEHSAKIHANLPKGDVHAKMDVFYNPVMVRNRNISITLLNAISNTKMNLALPLTGSGIRALRFIQELEKGKINCIFVNDMKPNFEKVFTKNMKLNKLDPKKSKIEIHNQEASLFLLNQVANKNHPQGSLGYFDYIDIDPFGTPNPFLAAAIARITREGIIAVTATDTAALTGTYGNVTKRKYWATSARNFLMHETGLRILIRKVQLQGVQFEKALIPILSYHKDHYFRAYFRVGRGKKKCDEILKQHQYLLYCSTCLHHETSVLNNKECQCSKRMHYAGPLWVGPILESSLLTKMVKENKFEKDASFLKTLTNESKTKTPFFYDLHAIAKKYKFDVKKMEPVMKKLDATRTHFSLTGIKTNKSIQEIVKVLQ